MFVASSEDIEAGIGAGFERAESFGLAAAPQPTVIQQVREVTEREPDIGPETARYFTEVITVASLGRQARNAPPLEGDDIRLSFSFFRWLLDGLVER